MKRWDHENGSEVENNKIDNFINDILELCKKHNFSIAHEDIGGNFIIENYKKVNIKWFNGANINLNKDE